MRVSSISATPASSSQTGEADLQSQSRIYEALLKNSAALGSELKSLGKHIWEQTVFKMVSGKEVFAGLQQRCFRTGARVHTNEITALASMISAFSQQEKRPEKLNQLVDELNSLGKEGDWGSTQANFHALLALRSFITSDVPSTPFNGSIKHGNTTKIISNTGKESTLSYRWTDPSTTAFTIDKTGKSKPIHVKFSQRFMPKEPGSKAPAVQKGFVVKREFIFISDSGSTRRVWLDSAGMTMMCREI